MDQPRQNLPKFQIFILLLWKNWKTQKQQKLQLFLILFGPLIAAIILIAMRLNVTINTIPETKYEPIDLTNTKQITREKNKLAFCPQNIYFEEIMQNAAEKLSISNVKGLHNSEMMETELFNSNYFAGVEFNDTLPLTHSYPYKLSYTIRFPSESNDQDIWQTSNTLSDNVLMGSRKMYNNNSGVPVAYMQKGFLALQNAVAISFLELAANEQSPLKIFIQPFPYPQTQIDNLMSKMEIFLPILLMLAYFYSTIEITMLITEAEEKHMKHLLKIMGFTNWMQWFSYFIKPFLLLGLTALFLTIMFKIKWIKGFAVFTYTSGSLLFFFLLLYCTSLICFCFMISAIVRTKTKAAIIVAILGFIVFLPYLTANYRNQSLAEKLIWCLLYNSALGYSFRVICAKEMSGEGAHWTNLFQPISIEDSITFGFIIIAMFISIVVSIFICYYAERIFKHPYLTLRKWNFILSNLLTIRQRKRTNVHFGSDVYNSIAFQETHPDKGIGVSIRSLKKVVGDKLVVPPLSINLFQNEITVFLGNENSGKSAIVAMLVGMTQPTSGSVIVNRDTGLQTARSSIGFCLQEDSLFDELTVEDHITFYCRLRAIRGTEVEVNVSNWLEFMQLKGLADVQAKHLSVSMKRKLSICCALCGGSLVVYLDEPTRGLDNESRWNFWKLLQNEKKGRTILVTTTSLTEAEVIGDRVVVLNEGEAKCYGSPLFLKKNFGTGYCLVCFKKYTTKTDTVTAFLRSYVPEISLESESRDELVYQLPPADKSNFISLLKDLPENVDKLQLSDYIIHTNTVRDYFIKENIYTSETNPWHSPYKNVINLLTPPQVKCQERLKRRLVAMFMKKFLYIRRCLLLPSILFGSMLFILVTSLIILKTFIPTYEQRPITYGLEQYSKLTAVLETAKSKSSSLPKYVVAYEALLHERSSNYFVKKIFSKPFPQYIMEMRRKQRFLVDSEYFVAATISHGHIIAWFNNHLLHTAPLSLNLIHNAIAYSLLGQDANITVGNKPMPYDTNTLLRHVETDKYGGLRLALNFGIAMSFISSVFIVVIIKERVNKFKLLQIIDGVGPWTYWMTHFIWDWTIILIGTLIMCVSAVIFLQRTAATLKGLGGILFLSSAFGFAVLPLTYLEAFMFNKPVTGVGYSLFINLVLVCIGAERLYSSTVLENICFAQVTQQSRCEANSICCQPISIIGYHYPGIALELVFLFILGLTFFLVLFLTEYSVFENIYNHIHKLFIPKSSEPNDSKLDDELLRKKSLIQSMKKEEISKELLVLNGITKYYKSFMAVNQIYMHVQESQCLGLYGHRKSGKTSILKMLIGESHITYGDAYVKGLNLIKNKKKIRKIVGYCPDVNPLMEFFTGRETTIFFCLLLGYDGSRTNIICKEVEENFGLEDYFDLRIEKYTTNEKRKLSIAIALVGAPELIFLDEPTAEVDTDTKLHIWHLLENVLNVGSAIILASENANECNAICTHLILLRNGECKFIGSVQYLRKKLSKGVILYMNINPKLGSMRSISSNSTESFEGITLVEENKRDHPTIVKVLKSTLLSDVKGFLKLKFPKAVLLEEYGNLLIYHIPLQSTTLANIFSSMEKNRSRLCIEHYRIRQTNLHDFLVNKIS